jgi:hypothetical protein
MSKLIEKIPGISALVMVFVSFILVLLMYVGGDAESILDGAGEPLSVPKFTDALLYWTYALMVLIFVIAILMVALNYVKSFISDTMGALKSLIPIALFVLIFVVAWNLGTGEKISIIGYEGTENEGFWAQFTDMVIYSLYALFIAVGATIVGSRIYVSLK